MKALALDFSLFPKLEEWGTGDEAMDNKLSVILKKTQEQLSFESIRDFYFYGLNIKTRAYNPGFFLTIELVTKALLFCLSPEEFNDHLMTKIKGDYFQKKRVVFELKNQDHILEELLKGRVFRYEGQIDFSLQEKQSTERNPFVRHLLKRSSTDLHVKIIFKDL